MCSAVQITNRKVCYNARKMKLTKVTTDQYELSLINVTTVNKCSYVEKKWKTMATTTEAKTCKDDDMFLKGVTFTSIMHYNR